MKLPRFIALIALPLLLALPAASASAQSCGPYNATLATDYSIRFGTTYAPGGINWVAGDFFGYNVTVQSVTSSINLQYFNTSGSYGGALHVFTTGGEQHQIGVHTQGISINSTANFSAYVCAPATPTPTNTAVPTSTATSTPIPPTSTPTNTAVPTSTATSTPILPTSTPTATGVPPTVAPFTPTMSPTSGVLVTATPVLTPTPAAIDVLVERSTQSFQLNIFLGAALLGVLILSYFRR